MSTVQILFWIIIASTVAMQISLVFGWVRLIILSILVNCIAGWTFFIVVVGLSHVIGGVLVLIINGILIITLASRRTA